MSRTGQGVVEEMSVATTRMASWKDGEEVELVHIVV